MLPFVRPRRWRAGSITLSALFALLSGCQNHITGTPPDPPWYRLTERGREAAYRRSHPPPPESEAHKAWVDAIGEANLRWIECVHKSQLEPDPVDRARRIAACGAEASVVTRAADAAYERDKPPDRPDERPGRSGR